MSKHLAPSELPAFYKIKNQLYKDYNNGFYVYAKPNDILSINDTIKYVVRYTGRPAMAQSRILDYDGSFVKFWHNRHEDDVRVEETLHVYDFIKRLIIHIPDKFFNMIRYYGLYAKEHKQSKKLFKLLNDRQIKVKQLLRQWRFSIELSFGYDPLKCSCGGNLIFWDIVIPP